MMVVPLAYVTIVCYLTVAEGENVTSLIYETIGHSELDESILLEVSTNEIYFIEKFFH